MNNEQYLGEISITGCGIDVELPAYSATMGKPILDLGKLQSENIFSFDPAFLATAPCKSSITYVDGDKGQLFYRGYPIEQLAESSSYLETCYLLLYGELPNSIQYADFAAEISHFSTNMNVLIYAIIYQLPVTTHPMAMLATAVSFMSSEYAHFTKFTDAKLRRQAILQLIAQIPVVIVTCYRRSINKPIIPPNANRSYTQNILAMMFGYEMDFHPTISKALDVILMLHADHEQNASTSTVRMAVSSGTNPYAAIVAGIMCLWGPAHGGANEAVLSMLEQIGSTDNIAEFIAGVKNKQHRLMGFGHRVYKNIDPRASIMRQTCYEVLAVLGKTDDQFFQLALKLEQIALKDEYFISKKLYPNVDFYSGIILHALGIHKSMFTPIFVLARTVGWLAHWQEMVTEDGLKIARPRQWYVGATQRDYPSLAV